MKKIFSLILVLVMATSCLLALTSCGDEPELDLTIAEANLTVNGYSVNIYDEDLSVNVARYLYAGKEITDDVREYLYIYEYKDSKSAELALEMRELEWEEEKEAEEYMIEWLEYCLENFASELDADDIANYNKRIANYRLEIAEIEELVCGRSGNIFWYGTKAAVEASKGF